MPVRRPERRRATSQKAKQLVKDAGDEGRVTVWGNNDETAPEIGRVLADMLNEIGFKAKPRILDGAVYFATIGNQKTKAQTGFTNWYQDFPHPADFIVPRRRGDSIQPTNNQNHGNVERPELNKTDRGAQAGARLERSPTSGRELDKTSIEEAYIAPYGHEQGHHVLLGADGLRELRAVCTRVYKNDWS